MPFVRSVFEEDGKYHPQVFLDECLYELQKGYRKKELMFPKELILINQTNLNNVCFVIIGILKILVIRFNLKHVIDAMIYQLWLMI